MKRNKHSNMNRIIRRKRGTKSRSTISSAQRLTSPRAATSPLSEDENLDESGSHRLIAATEEKIQASALSTQSVSPRGLYAGRSSPPATTETGALVPAKTLFDRGKTLSRAKRFRDSAELFRQSIATDPAHADAYYELGRTLMQLGAAEQARDAFLNCLIMQPDNTKARWFLAQVLPRVYASANEIELWRRRITGAVLALAAGTTLRTPQEVSDAVNALLSAGPNFLLAYQQKDDRSPQQVYGRLASRVAYSAFGKLALPARYEGSKIPMHKRIRIGYASETLCTTHTISTLFGGWITQADRDRFSIHIYHLSGQNDRNTEVMRRNCHVFRQLNGPISETVRAIRADNLDILVYPDLGMGKRSYVIAALRLAPVQCVSWGHPITSGLPTIDYFLSSALMETSKSESQYSEKVVLLPNLSIYYTPRRLKSASQRQAALGNSLPFPKTSYVFLCSQAPQKYIPIYDQVFSRIASRAPNSRFVFIKHDSSETSNEILRRRLFRALQKGGCDPERHLVFLPRQSWPDYLALNDRCDAFLDSIGWSGGNTTLEALAHELPVVTMPGEYMRGRHSYAMLKRVDLSDCIATSIDEYVEIAVSLAQNAAFRGRQKEAIAAGSHRIYRDSSAIDGLESFYQSLTAHGQS